MTTLTLPTTEDLWNNLFLALSTRHALYSILRAYRAAGCYIREHEGRYVLDAHIGPDSSEWGSREEWERCRNEDLAEHRSELAAVLKELWERMRQ